MPSFKKKLTPVFILAFCLIIIIISYNWTDNKQIEINDNDIKEEKTEELSLFKNIWNIKSQEIEQSTENPDNSTKQEQEINNPEIKITPSQNITIDYLTTESILAEIESLSLNLMNNQSQEPTTCSLCSANDEYLENALAMVGFLSWEEYFLSDKFKNGLAYYEANKELFWEDEYSTSLCENTLAAVGGGCSCDNAEGPCYTDTPSGRIWHCGGLCCCACCVVCCGI